MAECSDSAALPAVCLSLLHLPPSRSPLPQVRHDTKDPKQYSGANAAAGLAIGHYWLSGPDA